MLRTSTILSLGIWLWRKRYDTKILVVLNSNRYISASIYIKRTSTILYLNVIKLALNKKKFKTIFQGRNYWPINSKKTHIIAMFTKNRRPAGVKKWNHLVCLFLLLHSSSSFLQFFFSYFFLGRDGEGVKKLLNLCWMAVPMNR